GFGGRYFIDGRMAERSLPRDGLVTDRFIADYDDRFRKRPAILFLQQVESRDISENGLYLTIPKNRRDPCARSAVVHGNIGGAGFQNSENGCQCSCAFWQQQSHAIAQGYSARLKKARQAGRLFVELLVPCLAAVGINNRDAVGKTLGASLQIIAQAHNFR